SRTRSAVARIAQAALLTVRIANALYSCAPEGPAEFTIRGQIVPAPGLAMATTLPQRLAAILAADVAGYTALMEQDENATVQAWRQARADVIDPTVAKHHGRIVKLTGDGFLAEFATVESAMRAALAMQDAFRTLFAAESTERQVAFRMGVNIGDVWVDSDDIY